VWAKFCKYLQLFSVTPLANKQGQITAVKTVPVLRRVKLIKIRLSLMSVGRQVETSKQINLNGDSAYTYSVVQIQSFVYDFRCCDVDRRGHGVWLKLAHPWKTFGDKLKGACALFGWFETQALLTCGLLRSYKTARRKFQYFLVVRPAPHGV